tara:strand:- start:1923 stop:2141 length:219 start_codon:yes stop_codon:yes gene_type:complete
VLNGFALNVQQNPLYEGGESVLREWCREWDTNPRTHTGPDLKPGAFDHLSHPCRPPNCTEDLKKTPKHIASR